MNRRDFLKNTAGAALFTGAIPLLKSNSLAAQRKLDKIGLQLYSVRQLMQQDFTGTLTRVAQAGYDEVEFAGYYNQSPEAVKALLQELKITSPANHSQYNTLKEDTIEQTIAAAKIIGHSYLILPSLPMEFPRAGGQRPPQGSQTGQTLPADQQPPKPEGQQGQPPQQPQPRPRPQMPAFTLEKVKEFAAIFNRVGETCKKAGLGFAYHNHTMEFQKIEGSEDIMYDVLLKETNPDYVGYELDLGWAVAAGADPLAYFEKFPGRFPFFHVKDMNAEKQSVIEGQGIIDFASIFAQSAKAGVKYYIVEYEGREEPMASVEACVKYLKNLTF
ncbi:MAG TPA: sugar phosphate isomerase/epimerase [bacterium]|nr:sugar phosphate isomerase/epimerase [bacterium]HPN43019.1 sugar phosphate isomerase/epimerase [bacterium]